MPRTAPPESITERKTLNSVSRQGVGEVDQLEAEAGVGPVGAVAGDRLVVGQAPHRQLEPRAADPLEDVGEQPFVDLDHVVDVDEGHLDVELGEVGLAVGAQVLVAEAAGDLVVALEAGDHQQLLEELRRLRQRVEGALLEAAGDEEVAGALGGRAGQDRRLDVEEALAVEELAHRRGDPVAQRERVAHLLAAQVEVAVAQAGVLADLAGEALDLEGRRLGVGEQLGGGDLELELAGRQLGVDRLLGAPHDRAGGAEHVLGAQLVGELEGLARGVRVEDELDQAGAVAQVDEDQAAVVAAAVDPAGDPRLGVDPVAEHLAAPGVAVGVRPCGDGQRRSSLLRSDAPSEQLGDLDQLAPARRSRMSRSCAAPSASRISDRAARRSGRRA